MIKVLRNLLIFRSLVATYGVILEQNPSGILISKPMGPGKWVVENFDSISPGLNCISACMSRNCHWAEIVNKQTFIFRSIGKSRSFLMI